MDDKQHQDPLEPRVQDQATSISFRPVVTCIGSMDPENPAISSETAASSVESLAATSKRKRGVGLAFLDAAAVSPLLTESAKRLLQGLLERHNIDIGSKYPASPLGKLRKPIDTNMSDERILQLAQEGELSFLASLLRIIEDESGSVTTKFLIKACCLSVEPGKVPAYCDAKEMVMTALHFMSQSFQGDPLYFPKLPLIRPVSASADIEKRAYCKVGDWKLQDVLPKVLHLEHVFYESCDSYKWLAREHCVPQLTTGRNLLLLKGSPPAFCTAKARKMSAVAPRRKTVQKAMAAVDTPMTGAERQQLETSEEPSSSEHHVVIGRSTTESSEGLDGYSAVAAPALEDRKPSNEDDAFDDDGDTRTFLPST